MLTNENHSHFDRNNCDFLIGAGSRSILVALLNPRATLPLVALPWAEL